MISPARRIDLEEEERVAALKQAAKDIDGLWGQTIGGSLGMSEEQGISIRFLRNFERKDGMRQEMYGWYIGDGSAQVFSERTEEALRELGRLTELPAEDEPK